MEKNTTDPSSVPDDSNEPAKGATITSTEHEKTPERHSQEQPAESNSIIDVVGKKASEQRAAKPPLWMMIQKMKMSLLGLKMKDRLLHQQNN